MAPLGTPRRLAGMMLLAPRRCRMCSWLASESDSASASASCCYIEQPRQRTCVAPGPLTSPLRQQNLLLHIHYNQPLQPRATRPGPVGMLLQALEEEGADGSIGEPRAVDGCRNGPAPASPQPTHGFLQSAIDGVVLQPPQKTIQRGVVGHCWQLQCGRNSWCSRRRTERHGSPP